MKTRTCPICGRIFTSKYNQKYCSDRCRVIGERQVREAWKDRTGYREKDRERARRVRAELAAEEQERRAIEDARLKAERERKHKESTATRRAALERKAASGDPMSRMLLIINKYDPEYWNAFRDLELKNAYEADKPSTAEVNGLSIYTDNFGEEVVKSIQDRNIVHITH